jgi:hypothetical protein
MNIEYNITKYFEDNNLFDASESNGLIIKENSNTITIKGSSKDLIELADLIVHVAKNKTHIHLDDLTTINKDSNIKEIIIENNDNNNL